eukprot:TRINITY_DN65512_c0_g1_i1.p1 TRINITY_DN65512_c0_g1~~TRINITY_DN65512_c0_g1_i1.p1  ORF type:complete len:506 (+),score=247.50 TRINITY_DN65512_c0_g1_i1:59-1519(+)
MMRFAALLLLGAVVVSDACRTAEEWKGRSVYFLVIDRFSGGNVTDSKCVQDVQYCGGTFQGIMDKLDYIQDLGFDALWITPVVENTDTSSGSKGYHGYWAKNLYKVNPHFGTGKILRELLAECHRRNIYVMLDVVVNHMGYPSEENPLDSFFPFNKEWQYHSCEPCGDTCDAMCTQWLMEKCRLAGLPDLDESNPLVKFNLLLWTRWIVNHFDFDALRIDTAKHVSRDFLGNMSQSAMKGLRGKQCFTIGEVFNGDPAYLAKYQGPMDSVLHYALFYALRDVFKNGDSMMTMKWRLAEYKRKIPDVSVLGNFLDNHDQERFLHSQKDRAMLKNALMFVLLGEGIPVVYYGTEQEFDGGHDPHNREVMWLSGWSTTSPTYNLIKAVNALRKSNTEAATAPAVERYVADDIYAFTRADVLVLTTNVGTKGLTVKHNITSLPECYTAGKELCNILDAADCVLLEADCQGNIHFPAVLEKGEPKVFALVN